MTGAAATPPSRATGACARRSWSKAKASGCWSIAGRICAQQLLDADVGRIDAVIVTHDHADHCHGIDDLRPVAQPMAARCRSMHGPETLERLERRFAYAFAGRPTSIPPCSRPRRSATGSTFGGLRRCASSISRTAASTSLGIRFDEGGTIIGYAIDFNDFTDEMAELYQGVDVLDLAIA